jgi:hypothetical protein
MASSGKGNGVAPFALSGVVDGKPSELAKAIQIVL